MATTKGVILSKAGGTYRVDLGNEVVSASVRGRLKHRSGQRVLVGDRVSIDMDSAGQATIENIQPRSSLLRRRGPGRSRGVRAVAANLDQVVVVGAAASPDWDQHLMDRFVVVAEASELSVIVVVNKADLAKNAGQLASLYQSVGYRTMVTSAVTGAGLGVLGDSLCGNVSLFTGPTGVGKSTLLNAIQPGLKLRTGDVSRKTRAGRHTTVTAEMFRLDCGGYVVDTPGLRDIGLWGVDPEAVNRSFPEIARASCGCRFDDCRHLAEPDCAVHRAAEAGDISRARIVSYQKFLDEAVTAGKKWK